MNVFVLGALIAALGAVGMVVFHSRREKLLISYRTFAFLCVGMVVFGTMLACWRFFVAAGSFSIAGQWEYHERSRVKSPDGEVEAVIVTGDAGATTSTTTLVFVVEKGRRVDASDPKKADAVFRGDHLKNFKVGWKKSRLLEIAYDEARIYHFENIWEIWEGRDSSYAVEVRLAPTSPDFSVPAEDRMPYDLRNK